MLKSSEVTAATGVLIEKLFQSVPELAPFVRVIHGDGSVGAALVQARPDLVFLTGSTATGRKISQATAETMTPFICELGGKDPMVIAPDAPMDLAVSGLAYAALINAGQVCTSTERVYVHESIFAHFSEELSDFVSKLRLGNGLDEGTDIGPMIRNPMPTW